MKKLANILCVLMTLAVAGTASAACKVIETHEGGDVSICDDWGSFEDILREHNEGAQKRALDELRQELQRMAEESNRRDEKIARILDEFKYDAARQGMTVEDYVVDRLKKIQ